MEKENFKYIFFSIFIILLVKREFFVSCTLFIAFWTTRADINADDVVKKIYLYSYCSLSFVCLNKNDFLHRYNFSCILGSQNFLNRPQRSNTFACMLTNHVKFFYIHIRYTKKKVSCSEWNVKHIVFRRALFCRMCKANNMKCDYAVLCPPGPSTRNKWTTNHKFHKFGLMTETVTVSNIN